MSLGSGFGCLCNKMDLYYRNKPGDWFDKMLLLNVLEEYYQKYVCAGRYMYTCKYSCRL